MRVGPEVARRTQEAPLKSADAGGFRGALQGVAGGVSCGEGGGVVRATRHAGQNVGRRTANKLLLGTFEHAASLERAHTFSHSCVASPAVAVGTFVFLTIRPHMLRHFVGFSNNSISPAARTLSHV